MPQHQGESSIDTLSASIIKPEGPTTHVSISSIQSTGAGNLAIEHKLAQMDTVNGIGGTTTTNVSSSSEIKTSSAPSLSVPTQQSITPLHPLHQPPVPQAMQGPVTSHVTADVGNSACAVPEFELARRLGVRFDSSNAAWVARWTDATNDRKKSRWFSVAKYGNAPARRLAIQVCLNNINQSDIPNLRDLQDVLSTFGPQGGPHGAGYLVGGDVGGGMPASPNMAGVVRGTGVDAHMGKLGPQFGSHAHLLHSHHNPFAMGGLTNPMAGYMAAGIPGMGLHPGASPLGMFVQGVPQHHATQGMAPAGQPDGQPAHEGTEQGTDGSAEQVLDANGQPIIKSQYHQGTGADGQSTDPNGQVVKTQFDQTTTAASSVGSPSANTGIKTEGQDTQSAPGQPGVRSSDPAFLQSLNANPIPTTPPESASSSSSRFVLSGDSSSQESSDLETRSIGSHSDDEDEDEDGKEGEDGERTKRKKRKLDEAGNAQNTGAQVQQQQNAQANMFNAMNVYNPAANAGAQQGQNLHAMAAAAHLPPYYSSLYSGYPGSQQMLLHQMNGQAAGQAGLHAFPFLFQASMVPMMHPHFQAQHAAAAAAAGFLPHSHLQGHYGQQGAGDSPQSQGDSPTSATSPGGDGTVPPYKRHHGHSGSQSSSSSGGAGGAQATSAKMTCERGLHYSKNYRGSQECWIAVWNTKGGRIMHEAFDVSELGFEGAKQKAREARDAAHSNNVAVTENSRPSWKSHSNTGIPHVSLDSQQLRFRAHKFGRRLCRSFSFGRRRGSYASRESAFDAAVLWLIQTPTEDEIAAVSGCSSKIDDSM